MNIGGSSYTESVVLLHRGKDTAKTEFNAQLLIRLVLEFINNESIQRVQTKHN